MSAVVANPFGDAQQDSAGSRGLQTREHSIVLSMAMMAKRFPRDPIRAADAIRNAFTRPKLAEQAEYAYSKGGSDVHGPSIRAAEAIAQQWGNMTFGWREVSRSVDTDGVGVSEVEAYAVDFESTNFANIGFYVRHWRDTKKGGYALREERDIYELCANQAQRRKRACILALVPGDVVEMALDQAHATMKTSVDMSPEALQKMLAAFVETWGVQKEHIERHIQRRFETILPAQVMQLRRIWLSLKDGMSSPEDWFDMTGPSAGSIKRKSEAAAPPPPPPAENQWAFDPARNVANDPATQQQVQAYAPPPRVDPADDPSTGADEPAVVIDRETGELVSAKDVDPPFQAAPASAPAQAARKPSTGELNWARKKMADRGFPPSYVTEKYGAPMEQLSPEKFAALKRELVG